MPPHIIRMSTFANSPSREKAGLRDLSLLTLTTCRRDQPPWKLVGQGAEA
ncbi:hypothetical protein BIWAKO_06926 [Bosea sp. BIWAKO-01]|nr:hypothetical protein BIWAKO_06926 [Bosea sp. BIWAKO-01]